MSPLKLAGARRVLTLTTVEIGGLDEAEEVDDEHVRISDIDVVDSRNSSKSTEQPCRRGGNASALTPHETGGCVTSLDLDHSRSR